MPERWWVPVPGLDPGRVKPEHVHAAVAHWFDLEVDEHDAMVKPYAVSALAADSAGRTGIEIGTLTAQARDRLQSAGRPASRVRLGNQVRQVGRPQLLHAATWAELAAPPVPARSWRVDLLTPTTFRRGDRCSPLPHVGTILRSLAGAWVQFADAPLPTWTNVAADLWVADLDLASVAFQMPMGRHAPGRELTVSAVTGWMVLRAASAECAAAASPLIELAAYTGLGAMTRKGLGVTRVTPLGRDGRPLTGHRVASVGHAG